MRCGRVARCGARNSGAGRGMGCRTHWEGHVHVQRGTVQAGALVLAALAQHACWFCPNSTVGAVFVLSWAAFGCGVSPRARRHRAAAVLWLAVRATRSAFARLVPAARRLAVCFVGARVWLRRGVGELSGSVAGSNQARVGVCACLRLRARACGLQHQAMHELSSRRASPARPGGGLCIRTTPAGRRMHVCALCMFLSPCCHWNPHKIAAACSRALLD